jgi:prepilin-type N-terminal cleavage/methylation domain-containing protein
MKRLGFTLVELLVVIAIIALLISILAPSLKTAKDLTRQMLCTTNLRSLGMSLVMYAEGNRGNIMPGYNWNDASATGTGTNPDGQCLAFNGLAIDPTDGLIGPGGRHTIGWAYAKGVWTPPSLMYCPLLATYDLGIGDNKVYEKPWGTKCGSTWTNYIRITYWYYPCVIENKYLYGTQLSNFPGDKPTLCDIFARERFWAHNLSGTQWYMGFPDGHVGFTTNKTLMDLIQAGLDPWISWPDYKKAGNTLFGYNY